MVISMFSNTDIGAWQARHGLTAAQLQTEYETQKANGLYLINLQGGGSGSNTRYAVIFAQQDIPTPRAWRAVGGAATGLKDVGGSISKVDDIMQAFIEEQRSPSSSLHWQKGEHAFRKGLYLGRAISPYDSNCRSLPPC